LSDSDAGEWRCRLGLLAGDREGRLEDVDQAPRRGIDRVRVRVDLWD